MKNFLSSPNLFACNKLEHYLWLLGYTGENSAKAHFFILICLGSIFSLKQVSFFRSEKILDFFTGCPIYLFQDKKDFTCRRGRF
jgi:hypothetical protein